MQLGSVKKGAKIIEANLHEIFLNERLLSMYIAIYQRRFSLPSIDIGFWAFLTFLEPLSVTIGNLQAPQLASVQNPSKNDVFWGADFSASSYCMNTRTTLTERAWISFLGALASQAMNNYPIFIFFVEKGQPCWNGESDYHCCVVPYVLFYLM